MAFGSASAPGNRICVPFQREKRNYSGPTLPLVAASFSMGLVDERDNERVGGVYCRLCSQDGEIPNDVLDFRG